MEGVPGQRTAEQEQCRHRGVYHRITHTHGGEPLDRCTALDKALDFLCALLVKMGLHSVESVWLIHSDTIHAQGQRVKMQWMSVAVGKG